MESFKRRQLQRQQAKAKAAEVRKRQASSRTGQVVRSSVPVGDVDVPVVDGVASAVDAVAALPVVEAAVADALGEAHEAGMRVGEAMDAAVAAAQVAADAKSTADGKNSRRRGVTEPEPPEAGWVQGDQWVRDEDRAGVMVPVQVLVWNGTEFVPEQIIADDIIVYGEDGYVRLRNGVVTALALAVDALNFKTATGMELLSAVITGSTVRTAASGRRLQLDASGLRAFNAAGAVVATLSTGNSGLRLEGGAIEVVNQLTGQWVGVSPVKLEVNRVDGADQLTQVALQWNAALGAWEIAATAGQTLALSPRTITPGNVFALKSQLDAWTTAIDGTHAWVTSEGREYVRAGGAWRALADVAKDTAWTPVTDVLAGYTPSSDAAVCVRAGVLYGRGNIAKDTGAFPAASITLAKLPTNVPSFGATQNFNPVWANVTTALGVAWVRTNREIAVTAGTGGGGNLALTSLSGMRVD